RSLASPRPIAGSSCTGPGWRSETAWTSTGSAGVPSPPSRDRAFVADSPHGHLQGNLRTGLAIPGPASRARRALAAPYAPARLRGLPQLPLADGIPAPGDTQAPAVARPR